MGKGWFAREKEVEIEIHYVDINPTAEKTLLLVHGWPAVWSSWRNQILEFESTHRLIIPTLRGFGNSTSPADTEGSTGLADFGNDLVCVLEDAGVEGAVCVGHDWGSAICFDTAAEHPSKITALANSAVPYFPPGPFFFSPAQIATRYPTLSYQVYLTNDRYLAARELNARPRELINGLLAEVGMENPPPSNPLADTKTILGVWRDQPIADQKLVSKVEEEYWVDAFKKSGFESTIAVYQVKNRKRSVDIASRRKTHVINIPALYINPTEDALGNLRPTFGPMIEKIPNLEIKDMATNHWPQLEKPEEYNAYLKEFLANL
ncbi:Alpha/Beta hydrolase protein [Mrakia frigida]|uniref:alpha/beta fold hydrolase n=1 Tax=Mrakia frigida TaxID=29902 RepID=UPI003FCC259A